MSLNYLINNSYRNSKKIAPVARLCNEHRPRTQAELAEVINNYMAEHRVLKMSSIDDVAAYCYRNQDYIFEEGYKQKLIPYLVLKRYTLPEIQDYCYDLFVVKTLTGWRWEQKAVADLSLQLPDQYYLHQETRLDEDYSVDIAIVDAATGKHIQGVQVKPDTYSGHEYSDNSNTRKNAKYTCDYQAPVVYLFYNQARKAWNNFDAVTSTVTD